MLVTGHCVCTPASDKSLPELKSFQLPTPDWVVTGEFVFRHFPVGCEGCGICVKVEGCSREGVEGLMKVVWKKTNLKVLIAHP